MNKKSILIIFLICLFGLIVRLWKLGSVPSSLNWDEASWGYNAYSILKTGRDEYGNFLPIIFKAFGDYKSAIMVYLTVPSVAIFGLTEFAVRFPSALFGVLNLPLFYLFVKQIFNDNKENGKVALIATGIFSLIPWSFHYSRGAWEINFLLFFILCGTLLFLTSGQKDTKRLVLSAIMFGLSFYVYTSAKLVIPLFLTGLVFFYRDKIGKFNLKSISLFIILFGLIILPSLIITFAGSAGNRLKVMSIFSYPRSTQETETLINQEEGSFSLFQYALFHNDLNYYGRGILGRYLNHFSPKFLFFEGDWTNFRQSTPLTGQMNFMDVILLPIGIYFLISRKVKNQKIIWYLLLVTPLPAVLSRDAIQATRSYFMVIPLTVISAYGVFFIFEKLRIFKLWIRFLATFFIVGIYLFGTLFYFDQFFIHAPIKYSQFWQYGYKQAVEYVNANKDKYKEIVFTQKYGQPYIYWLFYTKYDPVKYQKQANLTESSDGDVGVVEKIDKISFRDIYWPADRFLPGNLYVGATYEIAEQDVVPLESQILKKIYFLDGVLAFTIIETKNK